MSLGQRSSKPPGWQPRAALKTLQFRADVLASIRAYFAEQGVWEAETPLLDKFGSSDPALRNFVVEAAPGEPPYYLQTSPEFAMKRLVAAGSGDIYQLSRAFRAEECGRWHAHEFTLLEWYRLGRDHQALMDDVTALVARVMPALRVQRESYARVFTAQFGLDPHRASPAELSACAAQHGIVLSAADQADKALVLDSLFERVIAAHGLGQSALFVYDFPVEQAAYARIRSGAYPVAERFELIIDGVEVANGYHELCDATEQRRRMAWENRRRRARGQASVAPDERFLAALESGMPACAGVALGVDRLVMLAWGARALAEVRF